MLFLSSFYDVVSPTHDYPLNDISDYQDSYTSPLSVGRQPKDHRSRVNSTLAWYTVGLCLMREKNRPIENESVSQLTCSKLSIDELIHEHVYECFSQVYERRGR